MSYRDRLRTTITLTSPSGVEFNPKWIGNEQTKEKKLGEFSCPNNDGTKTQDLGVKGVVYPLTLYFDGDNHDTDSKLFFDTCDEKGPWTVIHPVDGELSLQLVSVIRDVQPVSSASITVVTTSWIEPLTETSQVSSAQVASEVDSEALAANFNATIQAETNALLEQFSGIIAFGQSINKIVDSAQNIFTTITSTVDDINSQFNAITRSINDALEQIPPEIAIIAGQVQQLLQLPALVSTDLQTKLDSYSDLASSLFPSLPTGNTSEDKNTVIGLEVGLSAAIVGACQSSISGELTNRSQAIALAEQVQQLFSDITEQLDNIQSNFDDVDIDLQYFSNSQSYNNLAIIVGLTLQYLIDSIVSLKIEKTITLDRPRSPIEITVTEYGNLGDNDELLDFFIQTNALTGNDIRLLPAGREVLLYV